MISRRTFLKRAGIVAGVSIIAGSSYRHFSNLQKRDFKPQGRQTYLNGIQPLKKNEKAPNILLICLDDLGIGDLSIYAESPIDTPNIDQLAREGTCFTEFYSCAPLCSPSRAGLLTGRYPARTLIPMPLNHAGSPMDLIFNLGGVYSYGVRGIPEDEILLSEVLKARGYRTALIGKWHLGDRSPSLPNERGFDFFFGAYYSNDDSPYAIYRNDQVAIEAPADQNTLTQRLTQEALQFLEGDHEKPFFIYYAQPFPHIPLHASEDFRGKSQAGLYGDVVEEIDWSIGKILEKIKQYGLDDNTLVIFTSDNGPWWQGSTEGLRGRKNHIFEGSFRVPLILRYPGIVPSGIELQALSMNIDLFPTCLAFAGIDIPDDRIIDGVNLVPFLNDKNALGHETLYFYKGDTLLAIRKGDWKYVRRHMTDNGGYASLRQGPFLFNLEKDPYESFSQIESHPQIAQELLKQMQIWDNTMTSNLRGWLE